jgi:hypothetical protein
LTYHASRGVFGLREGFEGGVGPERLRQQLLLVKAMPPCFSVFKKSEQIMREEREII